MKRSILAIKNMYKFWTDITNLNDDNDEVPYWIKRSGMVESTTNCGRVFL